MNYQEILGEKANRHLEVLVEKAGNQYGLTRADRDDLTQIMVRNVLKRSDEYDEAASSRHTWLCSLLNWVLARSLKALRGSDNMQALQERTDSLEGNDSLAILRSGPRRPGNQVEDREVKRIAVQKFVESLEPELREICLRLAMGEKTRHAARAMNLSPKAWRLRMARIKEQALEMGMNPNHFVLSPEMDQDAL